jgi:hypothetical protein
VRDGEGTPPFSNPRPLIGDLCLISRPPGSYILIINVEETENYDTFL